MDQIHGWHESSRSQSPPPALLESFGRHASSSRDRQSYEESGPRELKKLLHSATAQLEVEALRASEAERELQNLTIQLKHINNARLVALQDATKAKEELKLYSLQLNAAQEEIYRAQEVLRVVDKQRYQAERDAAHSRSAVRKLNQEISINAAREEGRRMGLREGLERGRNIGLQEAQFMERFSGTEDEQSYHGDDFPTYTDQRRSRFIASSEDIQPPESLTPNASPRPPDPIPIPPPEPVIRVPDIHPRSYHNASPSVRHSQVSIPPDGYIPALDADHLIRIPPPHELSRPPPTPERMQSPPLPENEQTNGIPQSITPHRTHKRHQSSPGSNSTALSQFDMVNDPDYVPGRRSPLSVIHEVLSAQTSPNPESLRGEHNLRHQSSWGGSSRHSKVTEAMPVPQDDFVRMTPALEAPQQGIYRRPRRTSSSSSSPSALNPSREHRRRSNASVYTVPDINIQPPSRPVSLRQESEASVANYLNPANAGRSSAPTIPVLLPEDQLPQGFMPAGGYSPANSDVALPIPPPFPMSGDYHEMDSQAPDERPVIPDVNLYGHDSEDDVVSSAMSSVDTLTTLPPSHASYSRGIGVDTLSTAPRHSSNVSSSSNGDQDRSKHKNGRFPRSKR